MMGSRTLLLNMCRMTPLFIRQSALPCSKILVNRPIGGVRYYSGGVGVDISIKDVIAKRNGSIVQVKPLDSASAAAQILCDANVGSAIVMDGDNIQGIVTERDIIKKVVAKAADPTKILVKDISTKDIIAVEEVASVGQCMSVMNQKGMRHLPVVRNGKVIDVISIRDLIMAVHEDQESELTYLRDFVGSQGHMYSGAR